MVNTFMPEPDIHRSAYVLDYRRLGKQRVEAKQILRALRGETKGWVNHPAAKMWQGHEALLVRYGIACCWEWIERGYQDSMLSYFADLTADYDWDDPPWWFGDPDFHRSHQSNLVRKDPAHYRQFYPDVPDDLPYLWPV
jgi:Pyrimidine dimer DNA glycosylase